LDDTELAQMYDGEGLTTVIVDIVPDDMTRASWVIENDTDEKITEEQKRLQLEKEVNKALKFARLYRGAVVVMYTEKGDIETPLNINNGRIIKLKTYGANRIENTEDQIINEPKSIYHDDFELFDIRLKNGQLMKVHRSRCLVFKGDQSSEDDSLDFENAYWGLPVMNRVWDTVKNLTASEQGVANVMLEFNLSILTLDGLAQLLSSNSQADLDKVYTRIDLINASKSIINSVLLDGNDNFDQMSTTFTGVPEILDRMMIAVSTVTRIPVTKLFTRSPAGMNATGESDMRNYYDNISSKQTVDLLPELQYITEYIASYVYGDNNETYPIVFNSLWEPTEVEQSTIDKNNAETDVLYITNQVLLPDEVREKRFPNIETIEIDFDLLEEEGNNNTDSDKNNKKRKSFFNRFR
jgi:phage-related protein (TIGR01555 family)